MEIVGMRGDGACGYRMVAECDEEGGGSTDSVTNTERGGGLEFSLVYKGVVLHSIKAQYARGWSRLEHKTLERGVTKW